MAVQPLSESKVDRSIVAVLGMTRSLRLAP